MHVGGIVQEEFETTSGIIQLDNRLVIKHVELIRGFLQGLLGIVTKYVETVSDDVVPFMLEAHIVQTLFLQKKDMTREWERLCFLQREVTQLQKWMFSVFPSTAAHFFHQQKGTQVQTNGGALEGKHCKSFPNYRIVTTRQLKSTCCPHFPIQLP